MGQNNSKTCACHEETEGVTAFTLIQTKMGSKYLRNYVKIAKLCNLSVISPRLQPEQWRIIIRDKGGVLRDKGLLETAEAWFKVSKELHERNWSEQRVIGHNGSIRYLYHLEAPLSCMVNVQPPPYEGTGKILTPVQTPNAEATAHKVTSGGHYTQY
ncbi:hypothetical protein GDO86_006597 [Hymenochirus boettgeri]|uniref:Uncharacterized protein n=1 Tax=Hymenochirus boettgeri TaxID=247094 RepID=A0A8T2JBP1_9PIPI|nr:hypothetical protein GDO86_006597 [Hymenochirus boettgeri]